MEDEAKALQLLDQSTKVIRASDLINKEVIKFYGRSAMQAVTSALQQNEIRNTIDTLEKTRRVEDYVKSQICNRAGNSQPMPIA